MSVNEPSVVILIPAYNAEIHLEEAINSSLNQTYQLCRVVVINDGSNDCTADLLRKYEATPNLEIIQNEKNMGKSESLNQLLPYLKETYVALMDADDVMYPERIEKQVNFMQAHTGVGASSGFMDYIGPTGNIIGKAKSDLLSVCDAKRYVLNNEPFAIFCPCAILRTEIFKCESLLFRGQFWPADDIDMWNRIHEAGWQVIMQPEYLMQYRIHGSSAVTSNFFRTREQFEFVRECMRARRRGDDEPAHSEFLQARIDQPVWQRLNRWRKIYAKGMYRGAGFAVAERKYYAAILMMSKAFLMQPRYVLSRLIQQAIK